MFLVSLNRVYISSRTTNHCSPLLQVCLYISKPCLCLCQMCLCACYEPPRQRLPPLLQVSLNILQLCLSIFQVYLFCLSSVSLFRHEPRIIARHSCKCVYISLNCVSVYIRSVSLVLVTNHHVNACQSLCKCVSASSLTTASLCLRSVSRLSLNRVSI